jgi:ferrochelatase
MEDIPSGNREMAGRIGVLLVNLGTPDAANAASVRTYLREFLSDARVIERQGLIWKIILNAVILTRRPQVKARDYQKIWNRERNESRSKPSRAGEELRPSVDALGPRRGGLGHALRQSFLNSRSMRCEARLRTHPASSLYPQYAAATTATVRQGLWDSAQDARPRRTLACRHTTTTRFTSTHGIHWKRN